MQRAPLLRSRRFIVVAVLALAASTAAAEPRRTTTRVTLRAKPGERQAAIVTVPAGVVVTVLEEQGRWLRVRVGANKKAKVGWLTRTTLTADSDAPAAVDDRFPSPAWGAVTTAPSTAVASPRVRAPTQPVRDVQALRRGVALSATASLGYRSLDMRFASDGGSGLANYLVTADAGIAGLDVDVVARPARMIVVGADARVRASYSSPGLAYSGPTLPPGDIPFSIIELDGGVRGGWRRGAIEVALRAGVHYGAFLADDVDNPGRLPRERLLGATAGGAITIAPRRSRVRVDVHGDVLVAGDRKQTPGLEDGMTNDARALWVGAALRYRLAPRWSALGAFRVSRATTSWQGPSVRQPDVTTADRVDTSQILELGVAAEL